MTQVFRIGDGDDKPHDHYPTRASIETMKGALDSYNGSKAMTTKHPTDAMKMPCESVIVDGLWETRYVPPTEEELRVELIKAYDLGRQEALEDAAKRCESRVTGESGLGREDYENWNCARAIRSMKHEQH